MAQWSLPADYELLAELLRCGDTSHVAAALQELTEMVEANRVPKNKPVLEQRLRNIISLDEEPEIVAPAKELLVTKRKYKKHCPPPHTPLPTQRKDLRKRR